MGITPYSHLNPHEIFITQMTHDGLETIMTSVTAILTNFHAADIEIEIVMDNNNMLVGDFIITGNGTNTRRPAIRRARG